MSAKASRLRGLGIIVLVVLSVRLLAWTASANPIEARPSVNQTIPTRTPTPGPQPSDTPSPTSTVGPTSQPRTPRPSQSPEPLPASRTPDSTAGLGTPAPADTPLPPGTAAVDTAIPLPSSGSPSMTTTPSSPDGTPLGPDGPTPSGPGAATAGPSEGDLPAQTTSTVLTSAAGATSAALPPWFPAAAGRATPAGASCLWPVAGLLLVVTGGTLLAWSSRSSRKGKGDASKS